MWPRISNKRAILFVLIVFGCISPLLILFLPNSSPHDIRTHVQHLLYPADSIRCFRYNRKTALTLKDISAYEVRKGKSIFFHETSCRHVQLGKISLDARQACAVESAARSNPHWDVYITFSAPGLIHTSSSQNDRILGALREYDNVRLVHLNFENYTRNTPLEEIYRSGRLDYSSYPISHASDILRYLTLFKFGGIYMDLDVVVVKSMEDLKPNYAGAETQWNVAAGVISMGHEGAGHRYAEACLADLKQHFSAHEWGNNGPMIVTRLLRQLCKVELSKDMMNRTCDEFHVYPPFMFYPVPWVDWKLYFDRESVPKVFRMIKDSHVLHVWNKHSAGNKVPVGEATAYTTFARKFCPKVFEQVDQYF
ncbi:lactosylceramide 4-alpha-galactosyltransferase-like [Atheta coriaria]|uniref:lactosylceramide 4-alpha-galactosyltransferase-like n=1 Tax=Dalotia coriaria TaxID=877792 RepID=UPI0031F3BC5C